MGDDTSRRVAELRRELARQDAAWASAKTQLATLGDVTLAVPDEALEAIDRACTRAKAVNHELPAAYAVRG
jgi:hypothetical protein